MAVDRRHAGRSHGIDRQRPASDAGTGVKIYPPATGFAVADIGSPNGATGKLQINGTRLDYPQIDAGADSGKRYPVCFTDNRNGTVTLKVTGPDKENGNIISPSFTRSGCSCRRS